MQEWRPDNDFIVFIAYAMTKGHLKGICVGVITVDHYITEIKMGTFMGRVFYDILWDHPETQRCFAEWKKTKTAIFMHKFTYILDSIGESKK